VILSECGCTEAHPVYQALEVANQSRHYDFLETMVRTSLQMQRPFLSMQLIKALNFHAIACLHTHAGEYRPCPVAVGNGESAYYPTQHYRVQAQMEDFVNVVNRQWEITDPIALATFVLWRLNNIHPFINGNGRTARAACYFVICVKNGQWLPGDVILPELLRQHRNSYVEALKAADGSTQAGDGDFGQLHALIALLLAQQLHANNTQPATAVPRDRRSQTG